MHRLGRFSGRQLTAAADNLIPTGNPRKTMFATPRTSIYTCLKLHVTLYGALLLTCLFIYDAFNVHLYLGSARECPDAHKQM